MQSIILAASFLGAAVNGYVLPRQQVICGATGFANHTIVSGDTLTTLAQQYHSGICDIASWNHLSNPNLVFPGEVLQIPVNCATPDNTSCITTEPAATATCAVGPPSTYDVRSGDSLTAIAADFNITLAALEAANSQIENFDLIQIGQIINIPVCPESACIFSTYTIVLGDLFYDLAQTYGSTVGQVLAANVGVDPTALQPGQQIILPWSCQNTTSSNNLKRLA